MTIAPGWESKEELRSQTERLRKALGAANKRIVELEAEKESMQNRLDYVAELVTYMGEEIIRYTKEDKQQARINLANHLSIIKGDIDMPVLPNGSQ